MSTETFDLVGGERGFKELSEVAHVKLRKLGKLHGKALLMLDKRRSTTTRSFILSKRGAAFKPCRSIILSMESSHKTGN